MTQEKFEETQELNNQREAVSEFQNVLLSLIIPDMYTCDGEPCVAAGRRLIIESKDGRPVTSLTISDVLPLELLQRIERCVCDYANELDAKFEEL